VDAAKAGGPSRKRLAAGNKIVRPGESRRATSCPPYALRGKEPAVKFSRERENMILDVCGTRTITDPSDADIREALAELDEEKNDAFAILMAGELTYIQTGGDRRSGFFVEYQAGSLDEHFTSTDTNISLDDVAGLFIAYGNGEANWQGRFSFERMWT
jgi:hypothetical protein